jgi:hypothetical protein
MRTSVQLTLLAVGALIGAACPGPDALNETGNDAFEYTIRGANVLPTPADTLPQAHGSFNSTSLAYTFTIDHAPTGVIDSIAIYQLAASATNCAATTCGGTQPPGGTGSIAAVILCSGATACGATSGTGVLNGTATNATVNTLLRGYGGQMVVFTQTVRTTGVMRGTPYPTPPAP